MTASPLSPRLARAPTGAGVALAPVAGLKRGRGSVGGGKSAAAADGGDVEAEADAEDAEEEEEEPEAGNVETPAADVAME